MSHSASNAAHADSHGHDESHSHVIVGPGTLRTILVFLLFFTVLTVAFAELEVYIEHSMGILLPWWVNVIGAMAIAVVKSILVMAYFMQLKYDNPLNTLVMLFCFFALGLFLMFTGLDLFSRGLVYDFKSGPVIAGGTGAGVAGANNQPLTVAATTRFKEALSENFTREWLICADAIEHAAEAAAESQAPGSELASKTLLAKAHHMMDLHEVKVHPPHASTQAIIVKELEEAAASLPADAGAIVKTAAKHLAELDVAKAKASYSVDAMFHKLAAVAHGGAHESNAQLENSGNVSRSRTGLSGALETEGHASHESAHESAGEKPAEGTP